MFERPKIPIWVRVVLLSAGVYNICWGVYVCVWPKAIFEYLWVPIPSYLSLWQCIGMMVGLYGVLFIIAARDPVRYRIVVLIGLVGKILGPIGFFLALQRGEYPWSFGWVILLNDVLWWLPLYAVLIQGVSEANAATRKD